VLEEQDVSFESVKELLVSLEGLLIQFILPHNLFQRRLFNGSDGSRVNGMAHDEESE
jgi:hypothetical protein